MLIGLRILLFMYHIDVPGSMGLSFEMSDTQTIYYHLMAATSVYKDIQLIIFIIALAFTYKGIV